MDGLCASVAWTNIFHAHIQSWKLAILALGTLVLKRRFASLSTSTPRKLTAAKGCGVLAGAEQSQYIHLFELFSGASVVWQEERECW